MIREAYLDIAIARLEDLLDDLRRVRNGWRPTVTDFPSAPRAEGWWRSSLRVPILRAERVSGHPRLGNTYGLMTTPIALRFEERGLMRTESRWYRLGAPFVPTDRAIADAPRLENWSVYPIGTERLFSGTSILEGRTEGTPRHGPVALMDADAGWLLTESGDLYRLGTRAAADGTPEP